MVEKLQFLLNGQWRERWFSPQGTALTGPEGSGTSTPLEALFYVLGLGPGQVTVMPPVKACEMLRLVFRAAGVRWSATRDRASGSVLFHNLSDSSAAPQRLSVSAGKRGKLTAADFATELFGLPRTSRGSTRLGLAQALHVMMLHQATIATHYLGGLPPKERKLLFDVLLGLRDEELERLEREFGEVDRRHSRTRSVLNQFLKDREARGLDKPDVVRAEWEQKQGDHGQAAAQASAEHQRLSDLAGERGRLELAVERARAAYTAARAAADRADRDVRDAQSELARAKGFLEGLQRRTADPSRCSHCRQELPGRPEGHCRQCGQEMSDDGMQQTRDALDQALARVEAAQAVFGMRRSEADAADTGAKQAWQALEAATAAGKDHDRGKWAPQHERTLDAEKRASRLAGEVSQLERRLKEIEYILSLQEELAALVQERKAAQESLAAAREERAVRRKDRIGLWSQFLLARVREVDPRIDQAFIDPEDYSCLVDRMPFEDSSVAGGRRMMRNVCVLLALRDLGRAVAEVTVPPLLVIDSPVYSTGEHAEDQLIGTRLVEQLISVGADPAADGHACQVITASSVPLPRRVSGVREIQLSSDHRFFDHAPECPAENS
ncbi:hypothetical protein [Streptomyces sp. NEAU-S77]|uniref:hypothetical protein n=1 Tax=Streptomyces sp. NEAU-S77 TaxID=3411033 RepID=UPI003B9F76B2